MSAPDPTAITGEPGFQAGSYSVWAYDLGSETAPALLVLYEWEKAGMSGLYLAGAWGSLIELGSPAEEWHPDYQTLRDETVDPAGLGSLQLAQLIDAGALRRIGRMPNIDPFDKPPAAIGETSENGPPVAEPSAA